MFEILRKAESFIRICRFMGLSGSSKSVWNYLFYWYKKVIMKDKAWIKKIHSFRMFLSLKDRGIARYLSYFGTREEDQKYILETVLKEGMTILDAGANIGYYVLLEAAGLGKYGKIYALEPSPVNFSWLRKNIRLNDLEETVEAYPIALSNRNEKMSFYLSPLSNLNTFHPLETSRGDFEKIEVSSVDVVSFLEDKRKPDLLRMDVEGHEVEIFESLAEAISRYVFYPQILFEPHRPRYDDGSHNMRRQLKKLFSLGYRALFMSSTDEREAHFRKMGYTPVRIVDSDFMRRGIYADVSCEDAIRFICDIGYVRTVLLSAKK